MSAPAYATLLDLAAGALLLCAVLVVWRRHLRTLVRLLSLQGLALAALPILAGVARDDPALLAVGVGLLVLRGGLLPWLVARLLPGGPATPAVLPPLPNRTLLADGPDGAVGTDDDPRDAQPLINTTAALLIAALLTVLAYAVTRPLVRLDPDPGTRAAPVALAVVLIGVLLLVSRRRAIPTIIGFLILDNGIEALAFLLTSGVPLIVELGVSLDLLLAVLVLQVLTGRLRAAFGGTDLAELRELHE